MIRFGIPAEYTEKIIQLSREQNSLYETVNNDILVSLPALFERNFSTLHGLILKLSVLEGKKIILLTPKIEKEIDIPDGCIHSLPNVFSGPFVFFRGVFFSDENPVFIINPEKISGRVK
ncbi:MAG: hypothetical protein FWD13_05315 [Treponema sp.]|nr:hypothetical protein [Treponema sp.]